MEHLQVKLILVVNIGCNKFNFKSLSINNKKKSSRLKKPDDFLKNNILNQYMSNEILWFHSLKYNS